MRKREASVMADNSNSHKEEENKSCSPASMPKHTPFPEFAINNELLNELIMFLFATCTAALQFINIYRTNWWLPHANVNSVINLYNMEPFLIILILAMNSRRLLYCCCIKLLDLFWPRHLQQWKSMMKIIIQDVILALLVMCLTIMCTKQNYLSIFALIYLFIMYYVIFGFWVEPFLRFSSKDGSIVYFNNLPLHSCSTNSTAIRDEVEILKNDFNNRLKQIIFTAVFNAYYSGFLPCFFASHKMFYNLWHCCIQQILFILFSMFTMGIVCNYPSRYCNILHKASLHLGYWTKVDLRPGTDCVVNAVATNWHKATLWPNNSMVKYGGDIYRCKGPVTVALPNNPVHLRFHKLFHNPSSIYSFLAMTQGLIIIAGIILIYYSVEWHFILSFSFITLTNHFTFFLLLRDYFVTKAIYQDVVS